jgi:hypothetical protein
MAEGETMIRECLSYEVLATLARYGRSDAEHYRREFARLHEATRFHFNPFALQNIKVIEDE